MSAQLKLYTGDDEPLDDAPSQQENPRHGSEEKGEVHHRDKALRPGARRQWQRDRNQNDLPCTEPQRKAIFAAARRAGLGIQEVRDLCPNRSISKLTVAEAAELLTRLNKGTRYERDNPPRKPRRPTGTIAFVTDEQRRLIDRFRVALGQTPEILRDHLAKRKYVSDPSRTMDDMTTQRDAQAVIEHLKKVLYRMCVLHGRKTRQTGHDPDAKHLPDGIIKSLMTTLPPHDRLLDLYTDRIKRLARRLGDSQQIVEQRLAAQRCTNGRLMSAIATCADMAEAVLYLEQELARTPPVAQVSNLCSESTTQRSAALVANS